jgi:hypothetical protein
MFEVKIGEEIRNAKVTFYTALIYENEFGKDMLKEFFGVQALSDPIAEDGDVLSVDFTRINWTAASKALWAAIKTADESVAPYGIWVKESSGANMWLVYEQLAAEIADCFFRAEAAGQEAGQ